MLLHHRFIEVAKKLGSKLFLDDRSTGRALTYQRGLIATLILSEKFKKYDEGFLGIMLPTSAGAALSVLAALMSGRVPVMINYSTGAPQNCEFAQKRCDFTTIITARVLLEKIQCPIVPGMVFIEDILAGVSGFEKIKAALRSKIPAGMLQRQCGPANEHDTASVLFTSGSVKDPMAV